jgi:hypothetical protein
MHMQAAGRNAFTCCVFSYDRERRVKAWTSPQASELALTSHPVALPERWQRVVVQESPKTPIFGAPFEDLISATRFVRGFLWPGVYSSRGWLLTSICLRRFCARSSASRARKNERSIVVS